MTKPILEVVQDAIMEATGYSVRGEQARKAAEEVVARLALDDPRSTYWCLRTCICGRDALDHTCGSVVRDDYCGGFNPDWEGVQQQILDYVDGVPEEREHGV